MAGVKQIKKVLPFIGVGLLITVSVIVWAGKNMESRSETIAYKNQSFEVFTVSDPSKIIFGYSDSSGKQLRTFAKFKKHLNQSSQELVFAVNGGMFTKSHEPLGLFIDDGEVRNKLKLDSGYGNFYLKPNGVFSIGADNTVSVMSTDHFNQQQVLQNIKYATQSGPMLVIDGSLHPALNEGSKNKHIRNGVGINAKGQVVFAISNQKSNFYDFASLFRDQLACQNALYLDGAISKMYNEDTNRNEDGSFGVMIGVVK